MWLFDTNNQGLFSSQTAFHQLLFLDRLIYISGISLFLWSSFWCYFWVSESIYVLKKKNYWTKCSLHLFGLSGLNGFRQTLTEKGSSALMTSHLQFLSAYTCACLPHRAFGQAESIRRDCAVVIMKGNFISGQSWSQFNWLCWRWWICIWGWMDGPINTWEGEEKGRERKKKEVACKVA